MFYFNVSALTRVLVLYTLARCSARPPIPEHLLFLTIGMGQMSIIECVHVRPLPTSLLPSLCII